MSYSYDVDPQTLSRGDIARLVRRTGGPAGFRRRLLAFLIDTILIMAGALLAAGVANAVSSALYQHVFYAPVSYATEGVREEFSVLQPLLNSRYQAELDAALQTGKQINRNVQGMQSIQQIGTPGQDGATPQPGLTQQQTGLTPQQQQLVNAQRQRTATLNAQTSTLVNELGTLIQDSATLWLFLIVFFLYFSFMLGMLVPSALYFIGFWTAKGATPGFMLAGLRLEGAGGERIGLLGAAVRFVGFYFNFCLTAVIILPLGYLLAALLDSFVLALLLTPLLLIPPGFVWIFFDSRRQGWHDIMAATQVMEL